MVGMSSGARALEGIGARMAKGVLAAGRRLPISPAGAARGRTLAGDVTRLGYAMDSNRKLTAGIGLGAMGAAGGYGAMRRRGSQNYPMY
jgi:hypothetical protein